MTKSEQFSKVIATAIMLLYSSLSFSGGPLVLEGPGGHTPVRYQDPDITIHVETGDLGPLSNAAANFLVQDAFDLWNQVDSSDVSLTIDSTTIDTDIDLSNFDDYLPDVDGTDLNGDDSLNPLVYDANGEIIDDYFGVGQSDSTAGFAASILTQGSSYFDEGYAVISGKDLGLSAQAFKLLIAHEIGHFIGLDHSQASINNQETSFGSPGICSSNDSDYPLMYPFICRNVDSLHTDDIIALSTLYPTATFTSDFGVIQGVFVTDTQTPILGANIWAENISTGESTSIVSDYLMQGTGFYRIYLPEGNYTLHANSINTMFIGSSGVGPYSQSILDRSFTAPHPITAVTYQGDSIGNDEIITISAAQTQTINFSNSGAAITITNNDDDNDSIADLFGSTSHMTLLLLFAFLSLSRYLSRRQSHIQTKR